MDEAETKSSEPVLHYPEEAMLNACRALHLSIFELQSKEFQRLLERNTQLCSSGSFPLHAGVSPELPILTKRFQGIDNADRMVDDIELTVLNILDKDGNVTQRSQVRDFVFFMSRAQLKVIFIHFFPVAECNHLTKKVTTFRSNTKD